MGVDRVTAVVVGVCHFFLIIGLSLLIIHSPDIRIPFISGQLEKLFILYPDPHFKRCKHKWRIVSEGLLAEYAFVLAEGALVYTVSDVKEVRNPSPTSYLFYFNLPLPIFSFHILPQ